MAISGDEVRHVARLARLDLTDDEIETFRGQLDVVLERARRIQALELDEVPPTAHPLDVSNVLRNDDVIPPVAAAEILEAAPSREGAFFRAPRILEDED